MQVEVESDTPRGMILHWGINGWKEPPKESWPFGTNPVDGKAVQTPFKDGKRVEITFPEESCPNRFPHHDRTFCTLTGPSSPPFGFHLQEIVLEALLFKQDTSPGKT